MSKTFTRAVFVLLLFAYALTHFLAPAHAQSSLGIGTSDAITPSPGFLGEFMQWVNAHQQRFYRALTGALKAMKEDSSRLWILIGLSFAYGVFHAAGPGHGKAVISSYMLANEVALRRGIVLSFISAFLQAVTALVVMGLAFFILRGTSVSMTDATRFLEISSYGLLTAFGLWLLWSKLKPRIAGAFAPRPAASLSAAATPAAHVHGPNCTHHAHFNHAAAPGRPGSMMVCESCGHSHAPDPALISGENFDRKAAWSAIMAVGLRPCSGALIVLSFAFLNDLWLGGVLSVFAMALGTAITVSILAIMAVTAKNWAVTLAGGGKTASSVHAAIEIGGAALVFLLGATMLAASLST